MEKLRLSEHPVRRAMTDILALRSASALELSEELGIGSSSARYQVGRLVREGIVEAVGEAAGSRRARAYRLKPGVLAVSTAEMAAIPLPVKRKATLRLISRVWREVKAAQEEGVIDAWPHSQLTNVPLALDHRGWVELQEILTDAFASVIESQSREGTPGSPGARKFMTWFVLFEAEPGTRFTVPPSPGADATEPPERQGRGITSILKAISTPLQVRMGMVLSVQPASAVELAERLKAPLAAVRRGLGAMRRSGVISVRDQRTRRNTIENVYSLDPRQLVIDRWEGVSATARSSFIRTWISMAFELLVEATRAGALENREDFVLVRVPLQLGPDLQDEVSSTLKQVFLDTMRIRDESLDRLGRSGEDAVLALSSILYFPLEPVSV